MKDMGRELEKILNAIAKRPLEDLLGEKVTNREASKMWNAIENSRTTWWIIRPDGTALQQGDVGFDKALKQLARDEQNRRRQRPIT